MAIKEPRKFVTTDQGHADVLNIPITTLYENDQALAAQLESIKTDPAGNDIASRKALDNHAADTDLHVTSAKQAAWNSAEANSKQYVKDYAAPKAHTHLASDLPSASTQARGIVQLNTSTSSTATDQAATPSAVKAAYDRADQAFTQAVDLKNKIVGAINGKFGGASPEMSSDQIAAVITNLPVKRFASGTFNGQSAQAVLLSSGAELTLSLSGLSFTPSNLFVRIDLTDTSGNVFLGGMINQNTANGGKGVNERGNNNSVSPGQLLQQSGGFSITVRSGVLRTGGGSSFAVLRAYEWWAFE
ncbi:MULTISPECIES: tail fiber protein [Paenibacillus]|uniref:Tail fiber protein n=1 Tax=Paenibacillus polymyxa TaxID=1406 RepID=A0ABX2Z7Y1_PAEPO|nr:MULTISPECIES: phage tail protein [Paenibacillus]ODA07374.1 hypothetical protein A7312_09800 [Paenibacillus polymyxa]OME69606.1 hypothetical protein BK119_14135 [Paenibacillus peoriae]